MTQTCTPPPGTKPGTLHVLRRNDVPRLMKWHGDCWVWETFGAVTVLPWRPDQLFGFGWRYAGPAPDNLPNLPQTAAEIAREAIRTAGTLERTASLTQHYENALQAIADMEPPL